MGLDGEDVPHLNGLIRYDSRGPYRISPKSTHIKNMIVSMLTGVKNLTKYANKQYQTRVIDVLEKYQYMSQQGIIVGNTQSEMTS